MFTSCFDCFLEPLDQASVDFHVFDEAVFDHQFELFRLGLLFEEVAETLWRTDQESPQDFLDEFGIVVHSETVAENLAHGFEFDLGDFLLELLQVLRL